MILWLAMDQSMFKTLFVTFGCPALSDLGVDSARTVLNRPKIQGPVLSYTA